MSAWALTKTEIDILVWWLRESGISKQEPTSLGRLLWAENYKSLRARYGYYDFREGKERRAPAYHYTKPPAVIHTNRGDFLVGNSDQAAKMCHFYSYQSCEHDGWETSRAKKMIDKLETYLVKYHGADWQKPNLMWGVA